MARRDFADNLVTGLKAIGGSIVHYAVMFVLVLIFAFFAGGIMNLGAMAMFFLGLLLLLTGIFILGFIYNKFWGWE